jgi:hypothetical protein
MIPTARSAAMRPYSIAVAPDSSAAKALRAFTGQLSASGGVLSRPLVKPR